MNNTLQINAKFSNVSKYNPLFSRCDLEIMTYDENRNQSFISKKSVEKAISTIFNTPIVAQYIEEYDNFGDHGGQLEVKNDKLTWVNTTIPIGIIPESAEIGWEMVTDENGKAEEYLVAKNCFLWTDRFEYARKIIGNKYGVSMEISILDSDFIQHEGEKYLNIKDFAFSGICVLGTNHEDKESEDHVEPCFSQASITAYSLNKEQFKLEFQQLLSELKFSLKQNLSNTNNYKQEGGNKGMEQETKEFETQEEVKDDSQQEFVEDEKKASEEVEKELDVKSEEYVEDNDSDDDKDDESEGEPADELDYQVEYQSLKEKYEVLEAEFAQFKETYSTTETELEELRQFKANKLQEERTNAEDEIFAKFSSELTDEEMKPIKDKVSEFSLEDLEDKLFALAGRKKVKFSLTPKNERIKMGLFESHEESQPIEKDVWTEQKEKFSSK